ncbi:uncharacterized protein LOC110686948 [Chenopodium quinoa]|uniref:uncharacterized protein LOC110686948 n=1 Tax=Chenopodium quinoa TaxID=63459 RepID=UPI000B794EEE|nr:uncharacterized protein LOC110686948 [Chenopodium quinoa]
MLQSIHLLPPNSLTPSHHLLLKPFLSPPLTFLHKPTSTHSLSSNLRPNSQPWPLFAAVEEGPIELSPDTPSIFATNDDPTPLQVSTSVLLTGAITVFLFRSIRRRAKRAKELRMRASGAKSLKEEALDSLKAIGSVSIEPKSSPSPVQAFLGAITAAVIAAILYKFTTTIEASLNRQTIPDNYSVRQITVTIRTIINGLCYLATFVFGFNALGLFLYSGKLTLDSLFGDTAGSDENITDVKDSSSPNLSSESASNQENNDSDQTS